MLEATTPKSILLIAAHPKGTQVLRLSEERREIEERLRLAGYGSEPIHVREATRPKDIQQAMLDFRPQIVHFSCHGAGQDGLVFEDAIGDAQLISSEALANLFRLFANSVECVVLNACYSEFQAKAIAQHINYVIGMSQNIGDSAAILFARGFYTALGAGEKIEFAYEFGCSAIELEGVPESLTPILIKKSQLQQNSRETIVDWREAPDVRYFFNRRIELNQLREWILRDRCRVVGIFGIGGVGKTALATRLAREITDEFDYVFWHPLRNAPPAAEFLSDTIQFLSGQRGLNLPNDTDKQIAQLINYFRTNRCLLIFDNAESILHEEFAGSYRQGYEVYGRLIKCVAESNHQSCLLITSREKPEEIGLLEEEMGLVRSLQLVGIEPNDGRRMLERKGLAGSDEDWSTLIDNYSGNPLALSVVSEMIREVYGGNIRSFLQEDVLVFDRIQNVISEEFNRLSPLEKSIIYWLSIQREPLFHRQLNHALLNSASNQDVVLSLRSLRRRSLIEQTSIGFKLQNVVLECVTDRFINQIFNEIKTLKIDFLNKYPIIQATAKDYIRQLQIRLVQEPIVKKLLSSYGSYERIEQRLHQILQSLRQDSPIRPGYAAGNVVNLLCYLGCDLRQLDVSHLPIWQAVLTNVDLHEANFANTDVSESVFRDNLSIILCATFSPNGEKFATGDVTGEISIWETQSLRKLLTLRGHTITVWAVSFSPDGETLASCSHDQTIRIWDLTSGRNLQTLRGHESWVVALKYSPDGQLLASASGDETIKLWNVECGECVATLRGHTKSVHAVVFSPDGDFLASGSDDHTIKLWNIRDLQNCLLVSTLEGHEGLILSIAFNPDGKTIASGGCDSTLRLWDIQNLDNCQILRVFKDHERLVSSVLFSSDGQFLLSSSHDQTIRIWKCSDLNKTEGIATLKGHTAPIHCISLSSDNRTLVSVSDDKTIRLWNISISQCIHKVQGYTGWVNSLSFSADGQWLASGSDDYTVKVWNPSTLELLKTFRGHVDRVMPVIFSANTQLLVSGGNDGKLRLWNTTTEKCLRVIDGHQGYIRSLALSSDAQMLISGSYDQTVKIWNIQDVYNPLIITNLKDFPSWLGALALNKDDNLLAISLPDYTIKLFNIASNCSQNLLSGHSNDLQGLCFSPDGKILASASNDQTVRLWEVETGSCLGVLNCHTGVVSSVSFSADGCLLASGSSDQVVKIWDTGTNQCLATLQGHTGAIHAVTFAPNGFTLASSGADGIIMIWDVKEQQLIRQASNPRPYEGMNIWGIRGITETQKFTLQTLGAKIESID
jgi:WD40 repeat protein